jgi:hypothetical protein
VECRADGRTKTAAANRALEVLRRRPESRPALEQVPRRQLRSTSPSHFRHLAASKPGSDLEAVHGGRHYRVVIFAAGIGFDHGPLVVDFVVSDVARPRPERDSRQRAPPPRRAHPFVQRISISPASARASSSNPSIRLRAALVGPLATNGDVRPRAAGCTVESEGGARALRDIGVALSRNSLQPVRTSSV